MTAWCSHCYNTPDKMICRCQFHTIFRHQTTYVDYDFDWLNYINERFLSVSVDLFHGITTLWKLEMFNLTVLMCSFISWVFCSNKRCFLTQITWIQTLSVAPSVSILMGFDSLQKYWIHFMEQWCSCMHNIFNFTA